MEGLEADVEAEDVDWDDSQTFEGLFKVRVTC